MNKQTEKLIARLLFCATPATATAGIVAINSGLVPALIVFTPVFVFGWLITKPVPSRGEG